MNKRILLVTPGLKGLADGVNRIQPPLGLMLSAELIRTRGYEVMIHDLALEGWSTREPLDDRLILIGQTMEQFRGLLEEYEPAVVGVSALFSNLMDSAHSIFAEVKSVNKEIFTVLGGNHIAGAVRDYLRVQSNVRQGHSVTDSLVDLQDSNIDFAMYGEVDLEFPAFIDALLQNQSIDHVPGLITRYPGSRGYKINPPPKALQELDSLPFPARDLVNMEAYFKIGAFHSPKSRSKRVLSVMASRGCPEKCTFCTTPETWGSKVRWRSTEHIIGEIRRDVASLQAGEIQFEDDTLTANRKRLLDLCSELEKVGLPWCTPNGIKVNYHERQQYEMFRAMHDAGCYQVTLACETGVQRVMDEIVHKRLDINSIYPAIENAKKAGMLVHTFWILGFPGESIKEMEATIDFAVESGADSFSFAILSPLPGTPIYRSVIESNLFWDGLDISDLTYRSSLVRVAGFSGPSEFEEFVAAANIRANSLLHERDPERFDLKYGVGASIDDLKKQT